MTQRPLQSPHRKSQINLIWLVAFVVAAAAVGLWEGQYIERSRPVTPQARLQEALQAFRSGYDQAALSILKPLADEGNPKAQYWLSDIYENGVGVKPDMATALALLDKSATQGFVPAERHLGELYL
jgi:TPR repeat protein